MTAISTYPLHGVLVRGDHITIAVTIQGPDGQPIDVTDWAWQAQIRASPDGDLVATWDITRDSGDPSTIHLDLPPDRSRLLTDGIGFDLQQLSPRTVTWWSVPHLRVIGDYSHDD